MFSKRRPFANKIVLNNPFVLRSFESRFTLQQIIHPCSQMSWTDPRCLKIMLSTLLITAKYSKDILLCIKGVRIITRAEIMLRILKWGNNYNMRGVRGVISSVESWKFATRWENSYGDNIVSSLLLWIKVDYFDEIDQKIFKNSISFL